MKSLTAREVEERFGVAIEVKAMPDALTEQEEANVKVVMAYMATAYNYKLNKGARSVEQWCAKEATFSAPSTFPTAHTPEEYAESHSKVLASLQDLHIKQFDYISAKEDFVSLRYSAEGTHAGEPHAGIAPSGKKAEWTAQGAYIMQNGKIKHWWKDWDKARMWKGLGWAQPNDFEFA